MYASLPRHHDWGACYRAEYGWEWEGSDCSHKAELAEQHLEK